MEKSGAGPLLRGLKSGRAGQANQVLTSNKALNKWEKDAYSCTKPVEMSAQENF